MDFCLNTPNRQNWYFAHCHVHLWQTVSQYRFSAFWLRSKCSICSYQLNIWYGGHVPPSILNWFLQGDRVQELAPALSRVDLVLQYRQDRPTSPLTKNKLFELPTGCEWMNLLKLPKLFNCFGNIFWQKISYNKFKNIFSQLFNKVDFHQSWIKLVSKDAYLIHTSCRSESSNSSLVV